jgi:aspartate-semialdehyde dehydrogenase
MLSEWRVKFAKHNDIAFPLQFNPNSKKEENIKIKYESAKIMSFLNTKLSCNRVPRVYLWYSR